MGRLRLALQGSAELRHGEQLLALPTRKATAHVSGSAMLSMQAVLDDGTASTTTQTTCSNPPPFEPGKSGANR